MKAKKIPVRMCVACREMKPKKEMLRVVRPKEGDVFIDLTGKAAGRGAYVCNDPACIRKLKKRQAPEQGLFGGNTRRGIRKDRGGFSCKEVRRKVISGSVSARGS